MLPGSHTSRSTSTVIVRHEQNLRDCTAEVAARENPREILEAGKWTTEGCLQRGIQGTKDRGVRTGLIFTTFQRAQRWLEIPPAGPVTFDLLLCGQHFLFTSLWIRCCVFPSVERLIRAATRIFRRYRWISPVTCSVDTRNKVKHRLLPNEYQRVIGTRIGGRTVDRGSETTVLS